MAAPNSVRTRPHLIWLLHPQAASKQELDDFNAAQSVIGANSAEIAANDFAAKYPASELRIYLYNRAMYAYQSENNPPKLLAMAQKVLSIDPDHPVALVLTAYVLADGMEDNDPDHVRKVEEIKRAGNRAIKVLGSAAPLPLSATPEEASALPHHAAIHGLFRPGDDETQDR